MLREIPFDEKAICDGCGAIGAYDFIGDLLCSECLKCLQSESVAQDDMQDG